MRVAVVGSGYAGVAAAVTARGAGAEVTLVRGRPGASALSSGAYDLAGWGVAGGDRAEVPASVGALLRRIEAPIVLEDALVVGASGRLRGARGRDVQVLAVRDDATPIVVPECAVGTWDARSIAAALDDALRARCSGREGRGGGAIAIPIEAELLRHRNEHRTPLADLATAHDDPERCDWLIARLREALSRAGTLGQARAERASCAVLLPPILGTTPATVERIRAALQVDVGEALGEPGGAAALRFLRWSGDACARAGVEVMEGVVEAIESFEQVRVLVRGADGAPTETIETDAVVLACGGVMAGGITFGAPEHELEETRPAHPRAALRPTIDVRRASGEAPVVAWIDGEPALPTSSLFGQDPDRYLRGTPPPLTSVGLAVDRDGHVLDRAGNPVSWLFAAGDLVERRPRTALEAMASGEHVGRAVVTAR